MFMLTTYLASWVESFCLQPWVDFTLTTFAWGEVTITMLTIDEEKEKPPINNIFMKKSVSVTLEKW